MLCEAPSGPFRQIGSVPFFPHPIFTPFQVPTSLTPNPQRRSQMNQNKHTRRDFLKTTAGVTAAGLAVPYIFTAATARGEEAKSDKLTVAAIGVGGRGTEIGKQAARLGNMVACADVYLTNANNFANAKEFGGKCQVYQDYRKVLDRKDVQAVTIGTPDHWHIKVAIDAMAAGKDVYCEKPLTLTIDESKMICKAVKASDRVFQVGTQQRSAVLAGALSRPWPSPAAADWAKSSKQRCRWARRRRAGRSTTRSRPRISISTSGSARPPRSPSVRTASAGTSAGGTTTPAAR